MAMEPECLEPLNLVIKKDSTVNEPDVVERTSTPIDKIDEDRDKIDLESNIEDNMTLLQDAVKSAESAGAPVTDQKFLTELYMNSLMQMSNTSTLRNVSPNPYNVPQNFMQLLAMVEARRRMWQQLSWSVPPNFLRNPTGLPQLYYDGSLTNINEQLCNSPNSLLSYPLPSTKQEQTNNDNKQTFFKRSTIEQKNSTSLPAENTKNQDTGQQNNQDKKKPHIKKPLNAFMLYMKEMRAKVVAECTLKESAAINQILGRRWHALGRDEQAKYYELARRERQLHMQLYPDWSSRANTNRTKKRKRKQDTNSDPGGNNMKKCRARFGLDQQSQWCKPCSPVEHGAGMGIHASIIHHGVGSSAGSGGGGTTPGGPQQQQSATNQQQTTATNAAAVAVAAAAAAAAVQGPPNPNTASNASSPQQEPTYVNL